MAERRVDPARLAAYDVLRAVRVDDAYANLVLPDALRSHGLAGRDAAFATELASGTLRRRATYDAVLEACTDRPLARTQAKVLDALRLGAHQVLGMRVPAHAAIDTTVTLVRSVAGQGPAGFANAVLRRVARHDLDAWLDQVAPGHDDAALAVRHSHPAWVVAALREALGPGGDELPALLAADNDAPAVTFVARPGLCEPDELPGEPGRWSPYAVVSVGGSPGDVAAVREGRAGVQDEGSQLVALAAAEADLGGREERWLDLCAGPGGKAALLATLADRRGAVLVAMERQHHRARLVASALRATSARRRVVTADGTAPPFAPGAFDRVLVDAPCSGLGALRRRPESRWRRGPADLEALVPLQVELLAGALAAVRPGGLVLYATCSPVLSETAGVVHTALAAGHELVPLATAAPVLGAVADAAGPISGTVQLWPHRHGTDAMFAAAVRRR